MNVIEIEHNHAVEYSLSMFGCETRGDTVDLNATIQEQLPQDEILTRDLALSILKNIKLKSDVISFFTKPALLITLAVVTSALIISATLVGVIALAKLPVLTTGMIVATVALRCFSAIICALSGYMISAFISNREQFSTISTLYAQQSARAAGYIARIESNEAAAIRLA